MFERNRSGKPKGSLGAQRYLRTRTLRAKGTCFQTIDLGVSQPFLGRGSEREGAVLNSVSQLKHSRSRHDNVEHSGACPPLRCGAATLAAHAVNWYPMLLCRIHSYAKGPERRVVDEGAQE